MTLLDDPEWSFAPRFVETGEGYLHYIDEGEGPPVVLVHGTPTWSFEWRHVIGPLAKHHRVVAIDHLGFGYSDRPRLASYTPEAHARRFEHAMDALGVQRGITLVVHDYGGPIALPWALEHIDTIDRVFVLNSWMWQLDHRRQRLAGSALGRFLYRRLDLSLRVLMPMSYGDRSKLTPAIHMSYRARFPDPASRGRVLWPLARGLSASSTHFDALWARRERLARVPLHLIWGMADPAFGPDVLARWLDTFPHATVKRLARAGHWPHEEEPEVVTRALVSLADPRVLWQATLGATPRADRSE